MSDVTDNGPVSQREREDALRTKERVMRDRAWVARWLDGYREEASLMAYLSRIIDAPITPEGG